MNVSIDTVRRDLEVLEKQDILKRVHGGAILKQNNDNVLNKLFNEREVKNLEKKQEVASLAIELIEEGQAIALNGGTTTIEIAKVLVEKFKRLTIITNDLRILSVFLERIKISMSSSPVVFIIQRNILYMGNNVKKSFLILILILLLSR